MADAPEPGHARAVAAAAYRDAAAGFRRSADDAQARGIEEWVTDRHGVRRRLTPARMRRIADEWDAYADAIDPAPPGPRAGAGEGRDD